MDSRTWRSLLQQLRRRLPASAPAEDLLQSAYIRFDAHRQNNEINNPGAFIIRTAINIGVDENRRKKWIADQPVEETYDIIASTDPLQDEVIAARERLRLVNDALEQLPERTRTIFLLHRIEGRKYREIAETIGISQSAVEKHIARAALFLAERMENL
ncbi:MAG: sigma-70 family RNA polymerase sigma factor [Sphingobium sp.]|nr:sigma-70 family RNA polymerase sigma factor [Sphingobium sp.]